jgi:hypothetical protein
VKSSTDGEEDGGVDDAVQAQAFAANAVADATRDIGRKDEVLDPIISPCSRGRIQTPMMVPHILPKLTNHERRDLCRKSESPEGGRKRMLGELFTLRKGRLKWLAIREAQQFVEQESGGYAVHNGVMQHEDQLSFCFGAGDVNRAKKWTAWIVAGIEFVLESSFPAVVSPPQNVLHGDLHVAFQSIEYVMSPPPIDPALKQKVATLQFIKGVPELDCRRPISQP